MSSYRILRQIGRGGMAEVFLARKSDGAIPLAEQRLVALKRILPHFAEDSRVREMLMEEARLGAGFNHPNLVEAYDVGIQDDACFFTMDWVRGHELRHVIKQLGQDGRSLDLCHVLTIIAGVAAGLQYAHHVRTPEGMPLAVVHLDVCPSNVLITHEGWVKLIDFGVAQTIRNSRVRADDSYAGMVPAPGVATVRRGTMGYMSPEQCMGQSVDSRSDIFSLGIMLWEMTMWRRLFRGKSHAEVMHRVASADVPPPTSLRPDYPPLLEAIVLKALSQRPHARYETAIELQIALEDFALEYDLPIHAGNLGELVSELLPKPTVESPADPAHLAAPTPVPAPAAAPGLEPLAPARDEVAEELARRYQPIGMRWRSR